MTGSASESSVSVGDTIQLDYNGPGYDPVFEAVDIEHDYHIHLSNGATVYPQDIESGRLSVVGGADGTEVRR